MKVLLLLLGGMVLIPSFNFVQSECCENTIPSSCSNFCCGCGPCNIFCCNCDNGCNLEWWHNNPRAHLLGHKRTCGHWNRKRSALTTNRNVSEEALDIFNRIDKDGSMQISFQEAMDHLEGRKRSKRSIDPISLQHEMKNMDTNSDGFISPAEFDSSLSD